MTFSLGKRRYTYWDKPKEKGQRMNRRQFFALVGSGTAGLVLVEAIPPAVFDALPLAAPSERGSIGVSGHTAYLISMEFAPINALKSVKPAPFSVWITDGAQRLCMLTGIVTKPTRFETPIVIRPHQRLVVQGDVQAQFALAWCEPSTAPIMRSHIKFIEF